MGLLEIGDVGVGLDLLGSAGAIRELLGKLVSVNGYKD